ncbi:MAG: M20/M25/M40 family metallo-hydrolase [Pirellulaceae bacterium]
MCDTIEIAKKLIAVDSVTSHSNLEIAELQQVFLEELGFTVERLPFRDLHGTEKVSLAASKLPSVESLKPGIAFFCHNDVVSVDGWSCVHGGPFEAAIADGRLWGRGACDMKGPTAAALSALGRLQTQTDHVRAQTAPIHFFVTGDEECGMAGAKVLVEQSSIFRAMVVSQPVAVICEPTELRVVNKHKGGCHFDVSSHGVAAHSSTGDGLNANWQLIPFLTYLHELSHRCSTEAELQNSEFENPTLSLNVVVVNEPATFNITVGRAICRIFFRPMPGTAWESMLEEIKRKARDLELEISSIRCLQPLCTPADRPFVKQTLELAGQDRTYSVGFATDGCCFEDLQNMLVIGPGSIEQAHRADEWIDLEQLHRGADLYQRLLEHFSY